MLWGAVPQVEREILFHSELGTRFLMYRRILGKEEHEMNMQKLRDKGKVSILRKELQEGLKPKKSFEEQLERAKLILPQILRKDKDTDQGRINVAEMRRLLGIPHNMAYNIRAELLKELHAKEGKAS